MNTNPGWKKMSANKDLENLISSAIKKIGGKKENELCKYLPISSGGYMHHFTFRKMKYKNPAELASYIEKYIINSSKPSIVTPKKRAARGSRKKKDQIIFSRIQLERMLNIARLAGDKEIIGILSPKKSLAGAKKDLIQSIRQNRIDQELWNTYVEAISALNPVAKPDLQTTQS
ncbi:MAG: hypothetical protein COT84_04625 [Chlamydiae bacterium CG10_big_fil_rev_8_21_14_0_10_35_9]|nr:MAG: hypothetical protein COT84_04625 [Chlamydiae bacterium CG10_big_fil_rev_8_21_14_0_10_35_9]